MDEKPYWHKLVERAKNFHENYELFQRGAKENEVFFAELHTLYESIIDDLNKTNESNNKQILKTVFTNVYDLVVKSNDKFIIFGKDTRLHNNVFEACFFTTIGSFMNATKRIKGLSLREFLYKHSPTKYNVKGTEYYFDYKNCGKNASDLLTSEETALRQMRHRRLSTRAVYNKQPEWAAIRMDSEHEWVFYFVLNSLDNDLFDTYKRIGNLFSDINAAMRVLKSAPKDEGHYSKLHDAYKKFSSKLKKIDYEKFLELQKKILLHTCENKLYYGMNIYRLEKRLRPYRITCDVKRLLGCRDDKEENHIIMRSNIMHDLHFPKLYQDFGAFDDPAYTAFCADTFVSFRNTVVISSRLIIDNLIENGHFKDWENLFLDSINEMAEVVFYDPAKIDYTVTPKSQEKFIKIITAQVQFMLTPLNLLSQGNVFPIKLQSISS